MTFVFHTLLCLLALSSVFITPHILSIFFPSIFNESSGVYLIAVCVHIVIVIYFYMSRRYSLFSLPLSHGIVPVLFYFVMYFLWRYSSLWKGFETSWQSYVVLAGGLYFLPSSIVTLIISSVIKFKTED